MKILSDVGDMLTGGKLVPQSSPLPHGDPLLPVSSTEITLAIQERLISWTSEDFDITNADGSPYIRVRGAMLHLPGKDKMRLFDPNGECIAILDRKLMALKATYDVYRGDEKIGWIDKKVMALTDTFEFYLESEKGGFGPFAAKAAYWLEGEFLDRQFVMKNRDGQVVAKVVKDRLIELDAMDHYQVRVAPGMDAALVVACACAIDEDLDEENQKKREEQ